MTYLFCKRFLSSYGDRTVDQMVQAARSGKQNIAEGNQAASTSSETEIKLTNVAKASLEELLADYEDFLRTRQLCLWDCTHPRFTAMRQWTRTDDFKYNGVLKAAKMNAEELANLCLTLCHQSIYMLTQLEKTQQRRFVTQGGIREQMYAARTGFRQGVDQEMEKLRAENAALKKRIAELESQLKR
jgi:four helix bundle suffix protein